MEAEGENRNVSISVLRPKTKALISDLLNPQMYFPASNGILRYWQGLAGLCKIDPKYLASLYQDRNPTNKVLNLWHENDALNSTVQQLILFLEEMDRFDVIDDVIELIDEDIQIHHTNPRQPQIKPICLDADEYIITRDDVNSFSKGCALEHYDAFLLYDQDDIDFASLVLDNMEQRYNMKFCVKDRDLVGGGLEVDKVITLITERCNRVIVILSDAFFKSSVNDYFVKFAQAYGIENKRKIIPIEYKDITKHPDNLKYLFTLNYKRNDLFNFWDKLRDSIIVADPEKIKIARSKSDNGQTLQSALHDRDTCTSRSLQPSVKFKSYSDLNSLDTIYIPTPMNPSTSADNLESFSDSKKEKKPNFLKKFKEYWKKDKSSDCVSAEREKTKRLRKHMKRAAAVAN